MPYQGVEEGLYLVKQRAEKSGISIEHYALIDIGNVLGLDARAIFRPIVIHQTPPRIQLNWIDGSGHWEIVSRVADLVGAKRRLMKALENPNYNFWGNNCEQFARFIAENRHHSGQILWGTVGLAVTGFAAYHAIKALRAA